MPFTVMVSNNGKRIRRWSWVNRSQRQSSAHIAARRREIAQLQHEIFSDAISGLLCHGRRPIRLWTVGGFEDPALRGPRLPYSYEEGFSMHAPGMPVHRPLPVARIISFPKGLVRQRQRTGTADPFTLRFNASAMVCPQPSNTAPPSLQPFTSTGSTCCTALHRPATRLGMFEQ